MYTHSPICNSKFLLNLIYCERKIQSPQLQHKTCTITVQTTLNGAKERSKRSFSFLRFPFAFTRQTKEKLIYSFFFNLHSPFVFFVSQFQPLISLIKSTSIPMDYSSWARFFFILLKRLCSL
ncbi:LOW QUALITY PROTEIN: hypothetical protein PanWU01x14_333790 [Parasponia andersonii]|uniref:Uncharacterized protein n=1 Tax=Parasponia andersonii TaxID=3476 RepID=A0A2P5AGS7_PARAD|nr:LOW QUALITY PROTEIN: hypothetical protein PanWU01x14_333790 [Parasponia andersonii]